MAKDLSNLKFADLLPDNLLRYDEIKWLAEAIDTQIPPCNDAIKMIELYKRLDELPDRILDLLAWQYHVDFYDTALTHANKVVAVRSSIALHKKKGTVAAVERAVTLAYQQAKDIPWFKYDETKPYHFQVHYINPVQSFDEPLLARILRLIQDYKAARSICDEIGIERKVLQSNYHLGAALEYKRDYVMGPPEPVEADIKPVLHFGAAVYLHRDVIINE